MIQLADKQTTPQVRRMWKICFDDRDDFIDLYFAEKYKEENTLIYLENNRAIASLQMLPYLFTFCGVELPVAYISGACTLPAHRGKGLMGKLLTASFATMQRRRIPISTLIPAETWLYRYYARHGYAQVFDADNRAIPLKKWLDDTGGDIDSAYALLERTYRNNDFCIQKTKEDFSVIAQEAALYDYPPKTNLSGMARIIDAKTLLTYYAVNHPDKSVGLAITDNQITSNNTFCNISAGRATFSDGRLSGDQSLSELFFNVEISLLCRLIFGHRLRELPEDLSSNFAEHHPVMNLMLE
ncbi:MAG: GNAT family N-acetyltransferase [Prevotellaceae bacterium]|jgi:GNAT superfamily N-acetyltransferase|nr:GNAT family N-acetyltransferase [Prevotellaceae bacterium]